MFDIVKSLTSDTEDETYTLHHNSVFNDFNTLFYVNEKADFETLHNVLLV